MILDYYQVEIRIPPLVSPPNAPMQYDSALGRFGDQFHNDVSEYSSVLAHGSAPGGDKRLSAYPVATV